MKKHEKRQKNKNRPQKQTWYIELYHGVGFFRRKKFKIISRTYTIACDELMSRYPNAMILLVSNTGHE